MRTSFKIYIKLSIVICFFIFLGVPYDKARAETYTWCYEIYSPLNVYCQTVSDCQNAGVTWYASGPTFPDDTCGNGTQKAQDAGVAAKQAEDAATAAGKSTEEVKAAGKAASDAVLNKNASQTNNGGSVGSSVPTASVHTGGGGPSNPGNPEGAPGSKGALLPACATTEGGGPGTGCRDVGAFVALGVNIANWLLGFVGAVALLFFVYGGIVYLTSAGSQDKVKKGTDILVGAVIGLMIAFGASLMVRFVTSALVAPQYIKPGSPLQVQVGGGDQSQGQQCAPQCAGKQCGSDGCGGACGVCPSGQTCDTAAFQCKSS